VIELRTSEIGFACPICGGNDIRGDKAKEVAAGSGDDNTTENG
jgi:predicted RNA-binding Zn-ribbon protein involved in translation (DUF1610 family)